MDAPPALAMSPSSETAMRIAADRASKRNTREISSIDVLVGSFRSHQEESEPLQLLRHAEISPERFSESCEKADGGFGLFGDLRSGGPNAPPASQTASVGHSAEVREILALAGRLAHDHVPEKERQIRLRDLFGGVLLSENHASQLIRQALAESPLVLDQVRASYPEFLTWSSQPQNYKEFLAKRHPAQRFPVSGFSADTNGDDDLIGIGPEVNAMAYLIAATSLMPPLAIGLFGDWGSGKSFFMRALKRRVNRITSDARGSGEPQSKIDIYKYVVQIEFNAWHYVEGQLWASLVEHILRNLQLSTKDSETELQLRKKYWVGKLRAARREHADIDKLRQQLYYELDEKNKKIEEAEEKAEIKRRELAKLTRQDVWEVVKLTADEKDEIEKVIDAAGLSVVTKSTANLVATLEESRDLLRRGAALAPLRAPGWRGVVWVGTVLIVASVGPLLSLVLSRWIGMSQVAQAAVTLGGFVSAATGALAVANSWVRKWLRKAERAQTLLAEKRQAGEEEFVKRIAGMRTEQAELVEQLEQVKREGERKRMEIRELEQELDGLTPGRVLLDFINERVGSDDYRQHLGVAAMIRRDFDKLSELIQDNNRTFVESDTGIPTVEDEHRINRIVLYIDDLDRCPPDRVVEVLQAVHLLMAFPLFVVIVAVDSRWLSQSLRTHYDTLLSDPELEAEVDTARQATAHDYLEKIFQIPFWIRSLAESARMRIVQGLVADNFVRRSQGNGDNSGRPAEAGGLVQWDVSDRERPLKRETRTELRPQSLEICEEELRWMEALAALLGQSPRAVKRFVNVYRLIKASTGGQIIDFVNDRQDADFRLVLFLLAVVTGLPSVSATFFRRLARTDAATLSDLVAALEKELTSMRQLGANGSAPAMVELGRLKVWLETPVARTWKDLTTERLADWVRQVARFSYRIELA